MNTIIILNTINVPTGTLLDSICSDLWSIIIQYYNKPPSIYAAGHVDSSYPNYEMVEADHHFLGFFRSELHNNTIYSLCDIDRFGVLFVGVNSILLKNNLIYWCHCSAKGDPVNLHGVCDFGDISFGDSYRWLKRRWCLFKFIGS